MLAFLSENLSAIWIDGTRPMSNGCICLHYRSSCSLDFCFREPEDLVNFFTLDENFPVSAKPNIC